MLQMWFSISTPSSILSFYFSLCLDCSLAGEEAYLKEVILFSKGPVAVAHLVL